MGHLGDARLVCPALQDVGPEVRGLLSVLASFKASKTHAAISAALERFDDNAVYDTRERAHTL